MKDAGFVVCCPVRAEMHESFIQLSWSLRCVGDMWFILHVLQLLLIEFTQQHLCCARQIYDEVLAKIG